MNILFPSEISSNNGCKIEIFFVFVFNHNSSYVLRIFFLWISFMKPNKLADLILLCKIKPRRSTRSKVIQIMSHKCHSLSLGNLDLDCGKELYTGTQIVYCALGRNVNKPSWPHRNWRKGLKLWCDIIVQQKNKLIYHFNSLFLFPLNAVHRFDASDVTVPGLYISWTLDSIW